MNFLQVIRDLFKPDPPTLEDFIAANEPQDHAHLEYLERLYERTFIVPFANQ